MNEQNVHYVWVGSPTKNDPLAVAGHDVAAPIKMAKQLQNQEKNDFTNPIKFWCWNQYVSYYQQQFDKEKVDVKVCSIEELLKQEMTGDFVAAAQFVQEHMNKLSFEDTCNRVEFKDLFSLFLLLCQPGYFLDSNVFPAKGKNVYLPGEGAVITAKSGFQNSNDFFMMYSPVRGHPDMLAIFTEWQKNPGMGNLSAFYAKKIPYFPYFGFEEEKRGVKKVSYKSYFNHDIRGLFYWLDMSQRINVAEIFEENLAYGNINQQASFPSSLRTLGACQLCYLDDPVSPEALLALPDANEAYIAASNYRLYYINKNNQTCVLIYQGCSTLFDIFPQFYNSDKIKSATSRDIERIIRALQKPIHPLPVKNATDYHPRYIVNVSNCTVLHHAVLINAIEQVKSLLKYQPQLELKARYQIQPTGEILELTAKELADYLKHDEIAALLASLIETKEKNNSLIKANRHVIWFASSKDNKTIDTQNKEAKASKEVDEPCSEKSHPVGSGPAKECDFIPRDKALSTQM
ncbi:hypothetical protein FOG18_01615 [Legionella israelensis]|uniref:hypothetical protein n=1 Tax=Legionella israelensis TaxID=454 RepID=UPI00117FCFDA|nr:hypothetical protein [Legionella israelensis]QDP71367.1 hypothetical protein FOG18_01615 [Legionella israelensis]